MNEIAQGWALSVLGILVTFLSMGVFILIMVVLKRLFPYKEDVKWMRPRRPSKNQWPWLNQTEPDEARHRSDCRCAGHGEGQAGYRDGKAWQKAAGPGGWPTAWLPAGCGFSPKIKRGMQ